MVEEASIARRCPADVDIREEDHWEAMEKWKAANQTPLSATLLLRPTMDAGDLARRGLYLDLPAWGYHVFGVTARG